MTMQTPESSGFDSVDSHAWPLWPPRDRAIEQSLQDAWASGQWGNYHSDLADQLTDSLAELMHIDEVRLCCSGTMAVELALRGVGIQSGDEVVLAAYDYPGNLRCIELLGATPVLVDVEAGGVTMSLSSLQQVDRPAVKAVLISHLYGQLADVQAIRKVCDERGWMLVEDACQVPGAGWSGSNRVRSVGAMSHVSTLSFGGSKPLTAGSGGAVMTNDDHVAARIRSYAERPSDTFGLSPLQCAVLIPQLLSLGAMNERRLRNVHQLAELDWESIGIRLIQQDIGDNRPSYYKLALAVRNSDRRADLRHQLAAIGITTGEGFRSAHRMSERRVGKPVSLENASHLTDELVLIDHRFLLAEDLVPRIGKLLKLAKA